MGKRALYRWGARTVYAAASGIDSDPNFCEGVSQGTAQLGEDDLGGVEFAGCLDEFFVEGRESFRTGAAGQVQGIGEVDATLVPLERPGDALGVLG